MTSKKSVATAGHNFHSNNINSFLKGKHMIFDIGSGPNGSLWWQAVAVDTNIVGIDSNFFPKILPHNVKIYALDALKLAEISADQPMRRYHARRFRTYTTETVHWKEAFDMVVANHVLEHVADPEKVIFGMANLLHSGGIVYTGFPDGNNFTDVFYHLIHAEGGGHIQRLQFNPIRKLFRRYGFELIQSNIYPDDWKWFKTLYDYKGRGLKYITQKDIDYLARVFRKELTVEKGYYYGWEMVYQKK